MLGISSVLIRNLLNYSKCAVKHNSRESDLLTIEIRNGQLRQKKQFSNPKIFQEFVLLRLSSLCL